MMPLDVSTPPPIVIRTTAGLTAAATSIVAEFSLIGPGWLLAPTVVPVGPAGSTVARSSAPVARRARTVPLEASTADRSAAAKSVPIPRRPDVLEPLDAGLTGVVGTDPARAAGSYQRSGVVAGGGSSSWRDQSLRGPDGGE